MPESNSNPNPSSDLSTAINALFVQDLNRKFRRACVETIILEHDVDSDVSERAQKATVFAERAACGQLSSEEISRCWKSFEEGLHENEYPHDPVLRCECSHVIDSFELPAAVELINQARPSLDELIELMQNVGHPQMPNLLGVSVSIGAGKGVRFSYQMVADESAYTQQYCLCCEHSTEPAPSH